MNSLTLFSSIFAISVGMACGVALKRHQDCLDPAANSLGPLHMSPKRQRVSPYATSKRSPSCSMASSPRCLADSGPSTSANGEITEEIIDAVAFEAKRLIHSSSPRSSSDMPHQPAHFAPPQSRQIPVGAASDDVTDFVKSFFFNQGAGIYNFISL